MTSPNKREFVRLIECQKYVFNLTSEANGTIIKCKSDLFLFEQKCIRLLEPSKKTMSSFYCNAKWRKLSLTFEEKKGAGSERLATKN